MNPEFDNVAPDASTMIEALRSQGYTLSTAIADIFDNSIAANCRNIWLRFEWSGRNSWISITDDGKGMSEPDLVNSMRLGSRNPLERREPDDLGRFGLGLKTASFSQARRLTVATRKTTDSLAIRRWDLDYLARPDVVGWQLLKSAHQNTNREILWPEELEQKSGTVVLLEIMDRVIAFESREIDETAERTWVNDIAMVRQHLSMVFHRYLSDSPAKRISIFINGNSVDPWDPFCSKASATVPFPEDTNCDSKNNSGLVSVKGYVLPHRDKFDETSPARSAQLHQAAAGPTGWNAQQGFYLYRNRRLIIPGDWMGLGPGKNGWKKEEHFKLARIRIDIPNAMDQEWQIDIKKSSAIAPSALRAWLTGLAKTVREEAKAVYSHRGQRLAGIATTGTRHAMPWTSTIRNGAGVGYRIDRKHRLFRSLIEAMPEAREELETLLRLIEETVPVQRIWIDTAENQEGVISPFETESDARLGQIITVCHHALMERGLKQEQAWAEITEFPAFQSGKAQALVGQLKEQ